MKNITCFLLSLTFPLALLAQNPRIETFKDYRTETYAFTRGKGDSVRYTIREKADTIQTTYFYRNGKVVKINWRDSFYLYDVHGQIRFKRYGVHNYLADSLIEYNAKGRLIEHSINTKSEQTIHKYDESGELLLTTSTLYTPSVQYRKTIGRTGNTMTAKYLDTTYYSVDSFMVMSYDTLFYPNGRPYYISYAKDQTGAGRSNLGTNFFSKEGALDFSILPDSLALFAFKDNVDCYYGLKNSRGDTIMKPRFDHIVFSRPDNLIIGYEGDYCKMFTSTGKPLTQPTERMTNLYATSQASNTSLYDYNLMSNLNPDYNARQIEVMERTTRNKLFVFVEDSHKYGVMDKNGKVIIPPQYLGIVNSYIGDGRFFSFIERQGDSVLSIGYLDKRGKPIFPDYKHITYTGYEDYFQLKRVYEDSYSLSKLAVLTLDNHYVGLGKGGEEAMILEPKYDYIYFHNPASLFVVQLANPELKKNNDDVVNGIYNPRTLKWVLEAKEYKIVNTVSGITKNYYFVLRNVKKQTYCLIDTMGKFIITPAMGIDSIGIIDDVKGMFWVKKKGKFYLMDIIKGKAVLRSNAYDYLKFTRLSERYFNRTDYDDYFLAKKGGKWGFIKLDETIVVSFEYEYAADISGSMYIEGGIFLVKNGIAYYFNNSSLPLPNPDLPNSSSDEKERQILFRYSLADNADGLFFINDTGKVVIPPQYQRIENSGATSNYVMVEDAQKNRKLLFEDIGKTLDLPFKYDIAIARSDCPILIVKDTTEVSYGAYSSSGKLLTPCINYGVAIGDIEKGVYFVKRDTPLVQRWGVENYEVIRVSTDSLNIEDQGWVMHDSSGRQILAQPFRFPIHFKNGIGVGAQGDDFNLYNTEGMIIPPFFKDKKEEIERNFNNIRTIKPNGYYALYRNQGLTPTMTLTDEKGQILVETGRYDGISDYFGKYALVSSGGRVGLIDSLGNEIVKPQDLLSAKEQFMDSINVKKQVLFSKTESDVLYGNRSSLELPMSIVAEDFVLDKDSTHLTSAQRTNLLNLLLQKCQSEVIHKASKMKIERTYLNADASFVHYLGSEQTENLYILKRISIFDKHISFAVITNYLGTDFINFKLENGRWTEKNLYQILDLQADKRWALNDLLTQKIRALKDKTIDCSNSSAFITQVEKRFNLTENGIDFCFEQENAYDGSFVVISLTWAELAPFVRR
ncbi:MAG: WG repeat-containing protein [Saprospiraceae bacterium]|nr:WG repeat-containing protein [Saprospiraceae bacterium]